MKINLTEDLWNLLNPNDVEDGTAWMFSNDEYFVMTYHGKDKCFLYLNPLISPLCAVIHPWDKTAGELEITKNTIILHLKDEDKVLWQSNKIIPFKH